MANRRRTSKFGDWPFGVSGIVRRNREVAWHAESKVARDL